MSSVYNHGEVKNLVVGPQHVQSMYLGDVHQYAAAPGPNLEEERLRMIHNDILSSLAFPKMLDRRTQVEQPHPSTCRWILELKEYNEWVNLPYGLLWIKGKPGAGKSTLMSFLYDELRLRRPKKNTIPLDFFFSARGSELQRSPIGMFRSLLNQLFRDDISIRPIVVEQYDEKSQAFGQIVGDGRGWDWQRRELESLLSKTIIAASQRQQINIFIDALDEAGEVSAREIAQYFHTLNDQVAKHCSDKPPSAVSICISCRHYPIASSILRTEIWVEHHNSADIRSFVYDRLNIAARLGDEDDLKEWKDLEIEVVKKSQNIFQWARLVVPLLEKCLDEAEPMNEIRKLINQLPKELEDVYDYVVRNVINPRHLTQSYRLFRWVCLAERPLSILEISCALEFDDTVPQLASIGLKPKSASSTEKSAEQLRTRIKALSGGLIETICQDLYKDKSKRQKHPVHEITMIPGIGKYNRKESHVQIIHQSVNDFLMEKGLMLLDFLQHNDKGADFPAATKEKALFISRCQATLYWSCLDYFTSNLTEIEAVLEAVQDCRSDAADRGIWDDDDNDWEFLRTFPFAHYACYNILDHAQKAGDHRDIESKTEIHLIKRMLPTWINVNDLFSGEFPHPGSRAIHIAAYANLLDMLRRVIRKGSYVDRETEFGYTALHFASQKGYQQAAEFLISSGAQVNVKTMYGQTPFVLAAASDRTSLVTLLLRKEIELNTAPDNLNHALRMACENGQTAAVEVLLRAGADVNKLVSLAGHLFSHDSAIHAAMRSVSGTLETVKTLINAGADVNLGIPTYTCVIDLAREHRSDKRDELVKLLLDAGGHDVSMNDVSRSRQTRATTDFSSGKIVPSSQNSDT